MYSRYRFIADRRFSLGKLVNSLTGLTEMTLNTIYTQLQEPFLSTSNYMLIFKRTKLADATRQEIPNEAKEI